MASHSKPHHPWKTILRLEAFEQRDLPSSTHALLNPLHTLSHSLGLTAIQSKVNGPWELATADRTGTGQGEQQSRSAPTTTSGVDGQGQVTSTMSTDQGNTTSVTTDSASNTDTTSTGTVVNSDTTANNAQDNLTTNSSTTVSTVATGATPTDGSTTAALTVSVDSQTTQSVQIDGTTSVTVDQDQGSYGQSQTGDSGGTDQGNTDSNGNHNSTGGSSDQGNTDSNSGTSDQGNTSTTADGGDQGNTISAAGNSDHTSSTSTSDNSSAVAGNQSTSTEGTAQQTEAQSTDGSSTGSQSPESSTEYLPIGTTSAATSGGHLASARSEQPSALISSTYNSADLSSRIGAADTVNRANSVAHNLTVTSPHAPAGDAAMATSQDASHSRMDDMSNAGHQPLAAAALVGRSQVSENVTSLDHTDHGITQQVGLVEAAPAVDGRSALMAVGHQASSMEVSPIDLLMAAAARTSAVNPEAEEFSISVPDQENTVNHPAHSLSHLLNIALSGDVASLTDDFNQFFDKLEQVLNDPESLLSRFHPLSEAIAVGVAATAITAVHRRLKQNSRGRALQGWAGKAFDGYPGLGGPWVMAES